MKRGITLILVFVSIANAQTTVPTTGTTKAETKSLLKDGFKVTSNPFKHGIIFQPKGVAALTKTSWTIAIHYDITEIASSLTNLQRTFDQLRTIKRINESGVLKAHEDTLEAMFIQMWEEYQEVKFLAGGDNYVSALSRKKRGYIWDTIMHGFRISTTNDINALNDRIDSALKQVGDIITQSQQHTSVMRNITGDMKDQQVQVQQLVKITSSLTETVLKTLIAAPKEMGVLLLITYGTLMDALAVVHYHLDHVQRTITSLKQGKLEYSLMPPLELRKALKVIATQIPEELYLVLGTDNMSPYYDTIMCTHLPIVGAVRGVMKIPVGERNQNYAIYRAIPFPQTTNGTGEENETNRRVMWTGPPIFIGISKDKERYVNLGAEFMMERCLKTVPRICQDEYLISKDVNDHCLYQLQTDRTGIEPKEKCSYIPIGHDRTYITPVTDEIWAVSSVVEVRIQGHCMDTKKLKSTAEAISDIIVPAGEHVIEVPRHCTANIDGQWIPLRLQMQGTQYRHRSDEWKSTLTINDYKEWAKKSANFDQLLKQGQVDLSILAKTADNKLQEIENLHSSIKNTLSVNKEVPHDIARLGDYDSWLTATLALTVFFFGLYVVTNCIISCRQRMSFRPARRRQRYEDEERYRRRNDLELLNTTLTPHRTTFIRTLPLTGIAE